jgi:hypothetical protein
VQKSTFTHPSWSYGFLFFVYDVTALVVHTYFWFSARVHNNTMRFSRVICNIMTVMHTLQKYSKNDGVAPGSVFVFAIIAKVTVKQKALMRF